MEALYANRDDIVKDYERALGRRFEVKHAFALATKQDAVMATLKAAGVTAESEVILPVLADYEVAKAIVDYGATPVFCDIYPGTFIAQSEDMEKRMTAKTSAFMTTSQWGGLGDFPFHKQLSQKTNIPLINFATTGLGSESAAWTGKNAILECFGTDDGTVFNIGGGGVILTDDDALAEKIAASNPAAAASDLCTKGLAHLNDWDKDGKVRNEAATVQWRAFYPIMMHMPVNNYPEYILRPNSYDLHFLYKKPQNGLSQTPDYDENNPAFKRADDVMGFIESTCLVPNYKDCRPKLLTDYADMAAIHAKRSDKPVKEEFQHACNTLRDIVIMPIVPDAPEGTWDQLAELLYYKIVPGTYIPAPNFTAMLLSNRLHGPDVPPPPWDFVPDWFKEKQFAQPS